MWKKSTTVIGLILFFLWVSQMGCGNLKAFAANQVVVCNWGGNSAIFEKECFYDSFEKETGIKVIMTSPPDVAKIKAQVESGNIEWDLVLTDLPAILSLTEEGKTYLDELDYSKIDAKLLSQVVPEAVRKYSLGARMYSFNIAYNTKTFKPGTQPKTWADVWNVEKFPGVRSFNNPYGGIPPQYEVFLMADGVPPDEVYPIDVERAWKSIDKLKPHINKWYKSHAEAVQMLVNGETDIACTIGPRVIAEKWKGAAVDVEYNQGKIAADNWCIIKGLKNREAAYKLINYVLDAKRQACLASKVPYGPSNREAVKYLDPKVANDLNTSPENLSKQGWQNIKWWVEKGPDGKTNRARSIERFNEWLLK
jgi:putative spermidine/putrescine transport system substrate-binding protein